MSPVTIEKLPASGGAITGVRRIRGHRTREAALSYRETYQVHLDARVLENISTNAFVGLDDRIDLRQRGNLIEL